jgi:hypothetical protein
MVAVVTRSKKLWNIVGLGTFYSKCMARVVEKTVG